jgi:hypothetical protein
MTMSRTAIATANEPRVVHASRGRLRLHWPEPCRQARQHVETKLRQTAGVRSVDFNPVTRNVLIRFDPHKTSGTTLVETLRRPQTPAAPLARAAWPRRASRALAAARCLHGCYGAVTALRSPGAAVSLLALVSDFPPARRALVGLLGRRPFEFLCHFSAVLAALLTGGVVAIAVASVKAVLWLAEVSAPAVLAT